MPIVLSLFCMYAPFSHFYTTRLINRGGSFSHLYAPALCVSFARTPYWQGGHVALLALARREFRGRPPTLSGADVRYALTIILCFYCEITSIICLYSITLPMDWIASLLGSAVSSVVYCTCCVKPEANTIVKRVGRVHLCAEWWLKVIYFAFTVLRVGAYRSYI